MCRLAAVDRAVVTDALVQLRLIAHIEKRSREEVGSSNLAAQSATLTMEVEAFVPETLKERRAATATRVFPLTVGRRERDCAFDGSQGAANKAAQELALGRPLVDAGVIADEAIESLSSILGKLDSFEDHGGIRDLAAKLLPALCSSMNCEVDSIGYNTLALRATGSPSIFDRSVTK